jgi:DNA modification methylase
MLIMIPISKFKQNPNNPRTIKKEQLEKLKRSIKSFPEMMEKRPMVCVTDEDGKLYPLGGNMRLRAIKEMGFKEVPETWVALADEWTEEQRREFIVKDNVSLGTWDFDALAEGWNIDDLEEWGVDLEWNEVEDERLTNPKKLSDRFIIPPFSVLDTKQGNWRKRKNYWLSLGIKSELGRENNSLGLANIKDYDYEYKSVYDISNGTSIFDPVLCELAYLWFNVPKGKILDPFAGGSVRGIVAAKLGFEYLGNDLRKEQIEANRINATEVLRDSELYPVWTVGDSLNIDKIADGYEADMIFSCPPYADLEVYSDDERDISNMSYDDFIKIYREIIRKSCDKLKQDRFAVFVVGDVRDKTGFYYDFISDTKQAFINSGLKLYNELILVEMVGNLAMRAGRYMNGSRKVGKQHQNVLVFYKGDPKKIKQNYPELDLSYLEDQIEE